MSYVLHSRRRLAKVRNWKEKKLGKCIVLIDHPRMYIKGKKYPNVTSDPEYPNYIAFYGIPYAEPPLGNLRFLPPQPLQVTSKRGPPLLKAYYSNYLPSMHYRLLRFRNPRERGKEDCLYLNIYMLKKPKASSEKLPVLAYILSGGHQLGSGDIQDIRPDAIIKEDLVFVTIHSRMNVFGFLNLNTENCRGNAGLKDQVQALKWIKANIGKFGGDPNNVTITGHGTGATCVNLHMISPLSRGLFHKAIVQSGGIYTKWGHPVDEQFPKRLFPKKVSRLQDDLRRVLVQCLKQETAWELQNIILDKIVKDMIEVNPKKLVMFCGPSIERIKEDAFIPWRVEYLMKRAKPVPLIAGKVEEEGYQFLLDQQDVHKNEYVYWVMDERKMYPLLMQAFGWSEKDAHDYTRLVVVDLYMPKLHRRDEERTRHELATFVTDLWFRRFYENFQIGETPTPFYVYNFDYIPRCDTLKPHSQGALFVKAPSHGDDIPYLYNPQHLRKKSQQYFFEGQTCRVSQYMCGLWGSFCRTGIPRSTNLIYRNIEWLPHTKAKPHYLNIEESTSLVKDFLHYGRFHELNELLREFPIKFKSPLLQLPSHFDFFPSKTKIKIKDGSYWWC